MLHANLSFPNLLVTGGYFSTKWECENYNSILGVGLEVDKLCSKQVLIECAKTLQRNYWLSTKYNKYNYRVLYNIWFLVTIFTTCGLCGEGEINDSVGGAELQDKIKYPS